MNHSTVECFSSNCGLCQHCCSYTSMELFQKDIKDNIKDNKKDNIKRTKDLLKFNESIIKKYTEKYFQTLKSLKYTSEKSYNNDKFKLIEIPHKKVCQNPMCKVMYLASNDSQKIMFPKIPIYLRKKDEKCHLCLLCILGISIDK